MSDVNWKNTYAAIWCAGSQRLRPVRRVDLVVSDQLLGVERQKRALMENPRRFLHSRGSNDALLLGARGRSSTTSAEP